MVQGYSDILQWWRSHRLEFPALNHLESNVFCAMANSAASDGVFSTAEHVVNRRPNLKIRQ